MGLRRNVTGTSSYWRVFRLKMRTQVRPFLTRKERNMKENTYGHYNSISLFHIGVKPQERIKHPVLLMVETHDIPERGEEAEEAEEAARKVAENFQIEKFDTGHWIHLEDVEGTNRTLERFLKEALEGSK
jgi:pimeloyl-ACP methyl ester carboxylesterase